MRESAKKFAQKVAGEGGLRLVSSLFILFLARQLGAEDFGRYSSALAFASLCIVLVDLGTNQILTREIARKPQERVRMAEASHLLKATASIGAWLLLYALTFLLNFQPEQRFMTLCLGIVVIWQSLAEYFGALLSGIEEMGWEAILKTLSRLVSLIPGFCALAMHQPLPVIVLSMAIGTLAGYALAAGIIYYRFSSFGFVYDKAFLKGLLYAAAPVFGSILFWNLYDAQDVLLLNYFHFPQRDIGHFSAAMKIIDVLRVYPILVMGVFFPVLSKLHLTDTAAFAVKRKRLQLFMAGSLALLVSMAYVAAPWMIRVLYKADFSPAAIYLRLLLPALIASGMNYMQALVLISLNQERRLLWGAFGICAVNGFLVWALLPLYGVSGACYALVGSEALYFIFLRYWTARSL